MANKNKMVEIIVNGQKVEAEEGSLLIHAIEKTGISVPTLCYHKALSPYGACRLCVVEVKVPGRDSTLQASCSYPVHEGLEVLTDTERVKRARKIVAELLLARCPDSEVIQRIAFEFGVKEPRIKKKNDDCIYCGLCVRICEERMKRSAIGFTGRGSRKKLEPPFRKYNEMCWTCGACNFICPVGKKVTALTTPKEFIPIPNAYNMGLNSRPSVYILYPQAIPNKAVIDKDTCIHLQFGACGICKEVCPTNAIDYEQKEKEREINVGAIILSPGFEPFDPVIKEEYGYGKYPNVISALEFERILSASGPYSGEVLRPYDKKKPKRIAFIQCVGSRDNERDYCSAVCCMFATKEAIIAKEHAGEDLECDIYYMDIRAYGKGFEAYYETAKKHGVRYIRCRPAKIEEIPESKNLIVHYLTENDQKASQEYDMVVLSIGMVPPKNLKELSERLGIELNEFKFCKTGVFNPVATGREGIYVAGPFTGPKDIPETVMQASAAAAEALSLLSDVKGTLIKVKEYPPEIDVTGQEPRIGVFVCHCGTNIAAVVNVPEVVEYAKTLPNVVWAENFLYTCSSDSIEKIKERIREHNLNRVVVASCTPRTHEPLFRSGIREAGLNEYLFEMANIRDQCSWVHMQEKEKATKKSKDLVRMAVAKARLIEPLKKGKLNITKAALVIGGGVAGMTSALKIAEQGYDVYLVEKEKELGGNMRKVKYLFNGEDPQKEMRILINKVIAHPKIRLFLGSQIESVQGSIGNFRTKINTKGLTTEVEHGITVIAVGAKEYKPREYLYGEDDRVLTQIELEEKLATEGLKKPQTFVMIQCVGSRDEERPYCSRICCNEAVKNALKIKELSPGSNVYILYRDVRTYGFNESYYSKARQSGVAFIRYTEDRKPQVSRNGNKLMVSVHDSILGIEIEIPADRVVLSTGIVPNEDNKEIAQFFKVPLNQDRFFLEAHIKLRPVDFATEGVFLAGLAHSPKLVDESIIQAKAAAARASTILSQDHLELEANISHIIDENCDGCAYCVEPCPFKAITLLEYMYKGAVKKVVEVNESICKGCGCCMATCPKRGAMVKGFTLDQIKAQIEAALAA